MEIRLFTLARQGRAHVVNTRGRKGSMLLLVLIILAVALILITSALTITLAARQRYYKDAENEQANLTAMSAAKMIGDAIENKDFMDGDYAKLEALANNGVTYDLTSSGLTIPGLAGTSDSQTQATFGYYVNNATGKKYISVTVTTKINVGVSATASDETVTLLLEKKSIVSKAFTNLVTLGVSGATANDVGKLGFGSSSGNSAGVVVFGDIDASTSGSSTFWCDTIITDQLAGSKGEDFYGNVVFYGDDASFSVESSGKSLTQNDATKHVFFLRKSPGSVFTDAAGKPVTNASVKFKVSGGMYLLNSNFSDSQASFGTGVFVGPNSTSSPNTPYTGSLTQESVNAYIANVEASVSRKLLIYPQAELLALFPYTTATSVKINSTQITSTDLNNGASKPQASDVHKSDYYIDVSSAATVKKDLTFDLKNGSINLFIFGGKTLTVSANINFINGDANHVGKIFLLDGSDLYISGGLTGSANNTTASPYLYIYGLGETTDASGIANQITVYGGTLWGYVGLYGKNGKIILDKQPSIYCRLEAAYLEAGQNIGGSNKYGFPNCPAPLSDQGGSTSSINYVTAGYVVN